MKARQQGFHMRPISWPRSSQLLSYRLSFLRTRILSPAPRMSGTVSHELGIKEDASASNFLPSSFGMASGAGRQAARHRDQRARGEAAPDLAEPPQFAAVLEAIPRDVWERVWPSERTVILRGTSKRVAKALESLRPPAIMRLKHAAGESARCERGKKLQRMLCKMASWCEIWQLSLHGCAINAPGATGLAGVLSRCSCLSDLDLTANGIGPDGAKVLAGALPHCSSLSILTLTRNMLRDDGCAALAPFLPRCRALSELRLGYNFIGATGATRLSQVAGLMPSLSTLELTGNPLYAAGAAALVPGLTQSSKLSRLILEVDLIEADGIESLAGALPQMASLTHLNLAYNQLMQLGTMTLASVLASCSRLSSLDVSNNKIGGQEGAAGLGQGLVHCHTLTSLNLAANFLRAEGVSLCTLVFYLVYACMRMCVQMLSMSMYMHAYVHVHFYVYLCK